MLRKAILYLLFLLASLFKPATVQAQLASPIFDIPCNVIGTIARTVATASNVIREIILPIKEAISTVQTFFQQAHNTVNAVLINLRMVQQLIELEEKINQLFQTSLQAVDQADSVPQRWKHRLILANLYLESRRIFEVFDISLHQVNADGEKSIMNDEQRIILIEDSLKKARQIHTSMRLSVRRVQRLDYKFRLKRQQIQTFETFFEEL